MRNNTTMVSVTASLGTVVAPPSAQTITQVKPNTNLSHAHENKRANARRLRQLAKREKQNG